MSGWTSDVDFSLVVRCAKLSHAAYDDTPSNTVDLQPIALIDQKCWLFLDEPNQTMYVVFRGSDSISDLINNLNIAHKPYKNAGKIHAGYYEYYKAVEAPLLEYLRKYLRLMKKIVITGHSLGGACAVLASVEVLQFVADIVCITFGTPPIADTAFLKTQSMMVPETYRVINVEDWAPKLPIPGLHHVGKPIVLCTSDRETPPPPPLAQTPQKIVHSHGMARYVTCLHHCRRRPPQIEAKLRTLLPTSIRRAALSPRGIYARMIK